MLYFGCICYADETIHLDFSYSYKMLCKCFIQVISHYGNESSVLLWLNGTQEVWTTKEVNLTEDTFYVTWKAGNLVDQNINRSNAVFLDDVVMTDNPCTG